MALGSPSFDWILECCLATDGLWGLIEGGSELRGQPLAHYQPEGLGIGFSPRRGSKPGRPLQLFGEAFPHIGLARMTLENQRKQTLQRWATILLWGQVS